MMELSKIQVGENTPTHIPSPQGGGGPRLWHEARPQAGFAIVAESAADARQREALLDRAMGPKWKMKSSQKLRRGRRPSPGLAFVARSPEGSIAGTVRLWDVTVGESGASALLLGPLAVDPALKGAGLGSALMRHALEEARRLGHRTVLLVGDASYYGRFGFAEEKTAELSMPGPYERHRFLALELVEGALDGASGTLKPAGRPARPERPARADQEAESPVALSRRTG